MVVFHWNCRLAQVSAHEVKWFCSELTHPLYQPKLMKIAVGRCTKHSDCNHSTKHVCPRMGCTIPPHALTPPVFPIANGNEIWEDWLYVTIWLSVRILQTEGTRDFGCTGLLSTINFGVSHCDPQKLPKVINVPLIFCDWILHDFTMMFLLRWNIHRFGPTSPLETPRLSP